MAPLGICIPVITDKGIYKSRNGILRILFNNLLLLSLIDFPIRYNNITYKEGSDKSIKVSWSTTGAIPKNFTVAVGEKVVYKDISETTCEIPARELPAGTSTITITAGDVHTHYALSKTELDEISKEPLEVSVKLTVKR